MSEDLSAMIRVGVTVILVASLVATVLSLVVVAQSILSSGTAKLQASAQQIAVQDFEKYNQKTVTGVEVKSAIQLYEGQDISICVLTTKSKAKDGNYRVYGAILDKASDPTTTDPSTVSGSEMTNALKDPIDASKTNSYYTMDLKYDETTKIIKTSTLKDGVTAKGDEEYIYDGGKFMARLIRDSNKEIVGIAFEQYN